MISDDGRVLNEEGLRYRDEFIRHKVLDCVGDLYLAGGPMRALVTAKRSGHTLNNLLLRALFAAPEAWCWGEEMPEPFIPGAEDRSGEKALAGAVA